MDKLDFTKTLIHKIKKKKCIIAVIGLGYVGLPLCMSFLKQGYKLIGIDTDKKKINLLKKNKSYISTITDNNIKNFSKYFTKTYNFKKIYDADILIICVPTPIKRNKLPDLKYVKNVADKIDLYIKPNQMIILECTSYPGTTEEYFLPIFKRKNLQIGKNIFLGYSPEREDPGNIKYSITKKNMPKVIAGFSNNCSIIIHELYSKISRKLHLCSDLKTAEFSKLLENIYRSVNIGLVNELNLICKKMNINFYNALNAAKTKPFGFHAFYPGPGVGGHCIPVDPYYLAYKAKKLKLRTNFIKLAGDINNNRPFEVFREILKFFSEKNLRKKLLVLGITYKKNVDDTRDSPILKICELIKNTKNFNLLICDPYLDKKQTNLKKDFKFISIKKLKSKKFLKSFDVCLIGTNHDVFDYDFLSKNLEHILDCRNSFKINQPNIKLI